MEAIKLTNMENNEVFINLSQVSTLNRRGRGTTVIFDNGTKVEVRESLTIVMYLLEHYVFNIEADDILQQSLL
ncbi:MAG: hypothetical protein K6A41_10850 [Bacteroidales bacterium]|nr:hypothetical protein [Bacteroidales bacterium]